MCYITHFLRIHLTKYYILTPNKSITCKRCKLQTSTSVHVLLCIWETVVGRKADNSLKCPSDEGKKLPNHTEAYMERQRSSGAKTTECHCIEEKKGKVRA